ncbi:GntR family transcriptional regulator [Kocuria rhizophila]
MNGLTRMDEMQLRQVAANAERKPFRLDKGRSESLRDQVAARLRHALVAGELNPGQMLSAPTLATEFGVSPTPVREAMLDLVAEGHVVAIRYKGYRVVEISRKATADTLQVRSLIEVPLMAEVARNGVCEELLQKARQLARLSVEAAEAGDLVEFIRLDTEFHMGLLGATGNEVAMKHIQSLRYMTRLTGLRDLAEEGSLSPSAREHETLVDAIAGRDADTASMIMERHLGHITGIWASPQTS